MNKSNPSFEELETFSIPDDSVVLDFDGLYGSRDLVISGLRKIIKERKLTLPLGPELDLDNSERLLILNGFSVQLLITDFLSDEITIPLNHWYQENCNPQILLAAKIDDENNVVFFQGVLTSKEFIELIPRTHEDQDSISISIDNFKGGINRLFDFVRILEPSAIQEISLKKNNSFQWSLEEIYNSFKKGISVAVVGVGIVFLGQELLRPKLLDNIATIPLTEIKTPRARSLVTVQLTNACLISPGLFSVSEKLSRTVNVSFDRPLVFIKEPLIEIKIFKNNVLIWSKYGTSNQPISTAIPWPVNPIQKGDKYQVSFRPQGASISQFGNIVIEIVAIDKVLKLDQLVNSLGANESKWINTIEKQINNDKNLALALLFSDKAPKSKLLDKARNSILDRDRCN